MAWGSAALSGGWRRRPGAGQRPCCRIPLAPAHLVRMILASVTSPLAAKCSRRRRSSTYLGRFLTQMRDVGGRWGSCSLGCSAGTGSSVCAGSGAAAGAGLVLGMPTLLHVLAPG